MKIDKKEINTPIINGYIREEATGAPRVSSSSFGESLGTRKVKRLVLTDLPRARAFQSIDLKTCIATAEKVSWLQKFFYIQCTIRNAEGKESQIWVNKNSLKKRLSHTSEQKKILWKLLPNAAKKVDPTEKLKERPSDSFETDSDERVTPKENSPLLPTPKGDSFSHEKLISMIQKGTKEQITRDEIEKILKYVEQNPQTRTRLIRRNISGCERTLLLGPQNQNYLLLTRATNKKDRILGEGSFKKAKFAIDLSTGNIHVVAVSRLINTTSFLSQCEINTMNALKEASHVVKLHTSYITSPGELENTLAGKPIRKAYMVLEYCNQGDLYHIQKKDKTNWTTQQKLLLASDMAKGLSEIHQKGYLHRDIKPENIFVYTDITKTGEIQPRAKIADLGLACPKTLAEQTRIGGTHLYNSPEKLKAMLSRSYHATVEDDIWALGLTFYSLFEGTKDSLMPEFLKSLTVKETSEIKQETIDTAIKNLKNVPEDIKALLMKMLNINPKKRCSLNKAIQTIEKKLKSAAV